MPVPAAPDFAAQRLSLLQQLGLDPGSLAGFQDSYVRNTNNLYQQLAAALGQADTQQSDLETTYERNLSNTMAEQKRQRDALEAKLAFRGILNSSQAVDQESQFNQDYQNVYDQMNQAKSKALADLLNARNTAQGQYNVGIGGEQSALTQGAQAYLQQIAEKQAQQALQQQQAQNAQAQTNAILQSNQQIANQIAQQNAKPVDLSQFANLFVQNAPTTPVAAPPPPPPPTIKKNPGTQVPLTGYLPPTKPTLKGQGYAAPGSRYS